MALACLGAAALRLISPGESLARTPWPTSLTVHVAKGVRLAVAEAAERDGAAAGVAVAARLTRLIVNELLVYPARMVPFAIRTWRYRAHAATLEPVAPELAGDTTTAPTGVKPKTLELYGDGVGDGSLVLFVHGGPGGGTDPSMARYFDPKVLATSALVPLAHLPPSPASTPHPITTLLPCACSLLCDPLSFVSIVSLVLLCSSSPDTLPRTRTLTFHP